jgi:hypothetical protein
MFWREPLVFCIASFAGCAWAGFIPMFTVYSLSEIGFMFFGLEESSPSSLDGLKLLFYIDPSGEDLIPSSSLQIL